MYLRFVILPVYYTIWNHFDAVRPIFHSSSAA